MLILTRFPNDVHFTTSLDQAAHEIPSPAEPLWCLSPVPGLGHFFLQQFFYFALSISLIFSENQVLTLLSPLLFKFHSFLLVPLIFPPFSGLKSLILMVILGNFSREGPEGFSFLPPNLRSLCPFSEASWASRAGSVLTPSAWSWPQIPQVNGLSPTNPPKLSPILLTDWLQIRGSHDPSSCSMIC